MKNLAAKFFVSAVFFGTVGMAWGIVMANTQDTSMLAAHAHLMVMGWVSFAIFGLFYNAFPKEAERRLATIQFWASQAGLVLLIPGIALVSAGHPLGAPLAGIGSILSLASMVMFGLIAARGWR